MSTMTAAERNDLRSLIRQRARLMKTEIKQRRLELMSDFERQLSANFSYDQDETWKGAHALADQAVNRMVDERFAELVEEVRHLGRLPKPVVARPNGDGQYVIVDGEHGWRAAQEVGLAEIAVEVVEADDFEARRQTYKRNQHGEHDPVLLGRMFRQMMNERGLSQRALAKEITVSEGTVRNVLLFAEAAELRNSYAPDRDDAETVAEISGYSIRQLRAYCALPDEIRNYWLRDGADLNFLD